MAAADRIYRDYSIERDEKGMPTKLVWRGDYRIPQPEDEDARKLREWEEIYGKRSE